MKERRRRKGDRFGGRDIFEKEVAERIGLLVYLENDDLRRFRFKQLVKDRPLNVTPGAGKGTLKGPWGKWSLDRGSGPDSTWGRLSLGPFVPVKAPCPPLTFVLGKSY
jgi:hypothetical protein